ncbi:MAG: HAMP domain-containing histidine kinase [Oscillospiraceae bacterium]|nr:HAMP domain-containing histidine kinase [Oscillospiraceae bacterium]
MKHSITKRWLLNSLGIVVLVLLIVVVVAVIIANSYYSTTARRYLDSRMENITLDLSKYTTASGYRAEVRNIIESFTDKDKYELMAISSTGEITLTSSGFQPSSSLNMSDYEAAKTSKEGYAWAEFTLPSGEKVLSYTVMLSGIAPEYSAMRIMTTINAIDIQLLELGVLLSLIALAIVALMLFSGLYFVKSIVIPVRQISETARSYAEGDFSERIEKVKDDELGELCDAINYMATELENTDKIKNEFISSVSHELRTPLTAIKGWSETLCDMDNDPETFQKGMRVISGETQRLSQMVEELLDFSRIQDGRFTLHKETMDILAELEDAVLIYTERAKSLGIEMVYNGPEMLPFVYGDRSRLRQVFINIIDNAVKYSNAGGRVTVEALQVKSDVVILISDTGVGIAAEDLPKIKTKFYKANHTRRGSGIGLAVANEIVEMHGGSIIINSEIGKGTTVQISLPSL